MIGRKICDRCRKQVEKLSDRGALHVCGKCDLEIGFYYDQTGVRAIVHVTGELRYVLKED